MHIVYIFNVVEMCSYIFYLLLYWIYTQQKLLQRCTVQHSDVNMIQRGIESCLFSISSGKTDSSEPMNSQLRGGGVEAHVIC